MTIIDDRGTPLPDGHPLKGTQNIFGVRKPEPSSSVSTNELTLPPEEGSGLDPEQEPKAPARETGRRRVVIPPLRL